MTHSNPKLAEMPPDNTRIGTYTKLLIEQILANLEFFIDDANEYNLILERV